MDWSLAGASGLLAEPVAGEILADLNNLQIQGDEHVAPLLHHLHALDEVSVAATAGEAAVVARRVGHAVRVGVRGLGPGHVELLRVRHVGADPLDRRGRVPLVAGVPGHGVDRPVRGVDLGLQVREPDLHDDDVTRRVGAAIAVGVELVDRGRRLDGAGVEAAVLVRAVAELLDHVVGRVAVPVLVVRGDEWGLHGRDHEPAATLTVRLHLDGRSRVRRAVDRDGRVRVVGQLELARIARLVRPVRALARVGPGRRIDRDAVVHQRLLGDGRVDLERGAVRRPVRSTQPLDRRVVRREEREHVERVVPRGRRDIEDVERDLLRAARHGRRGRRGRGGGGRRGARRGRRAGRARRGGGRGGGRRRSRRRCRAASPTRPRLGRGRGGRRGAAGARLGRGGRVRGRGRPPSRARVAVVAAHVLVAAGAALSVGSAPRGRHGDRHRHGLGLRRERGVAAADRHQRCRCGSEPNQRSMHHGRNPFAKPSFFTHVTPAWHTRMTTYHTRKYDYCQG